MGLLGLEDKKTQFQMKQNRVRHFEKEVPRPSDILFLIGRFMPLLCVLHQQLFVHLGFGIEEQGSR
jgi:hypothetical protein